MFILTLTSTAPREELDPHRPAHEAWVKLGIDNGPLIAGGRIAPPQAGFLMARGEEAAVRAFADAEPYKANGLADITVQQVEFLTVAPGFEALND